MPDKKKSRCVGTQGMLDKYAKGGNDIIWLNLRQVGFEYAKR